MAPTSRSCQYGQGYWTQGYNELDPYQPPEHMLTRLTPPRLHINHVTVKRRRACALCTPWNLMLIEFYSKLLGCKSKHLTTDFSGISIYVNTREEVGGEARFNVSSFILSKDLNVRWKCLSVNVSQSRVEIKLEHNNGKGKVIGRGIIKPIIGLLLFVVCLLRMAD